MAPVSTTARLEFFHLSARDADGLYRMNADPEVMRYTGEQPFASVQETESFLSAYNPYARHGFGRWSLYRKDTGCYIGFCGLKVLPKTGKVDIGYRLIRNQWGQGLATEAARQSLAIGFDDFGLAVIVGRAMSCNRGSLRVLQKLGLMHSHYFQEQGIRWQQLSIHARDFQRQKT